MMEQRSGEDKRLFYSFNLDDHVPSDHLLRGIDRFFDFGDLRRHLALFYSHTGRRWGDPELIPQARIQYASRSEESAVPDMVTRVSPQSVS
jgi:hypothetical protein